MDIPSLRGYRARDAAASPLYRSVLDHLKTYLAERARGRKTAAFAPSRGLGPAKIGEIAVDFTGQEGYPSPVEHAIAVVGSKISGSLLDLLARIDGAASDLTFQGFLGAPTFRVSTLDVA